MPSRCAAAGFHRRDRRALTCTFYPPDQEDRDGDHSFAQVAQMVGADGAGHGIAAHHERLWAHALPLARADRNRDPAGHRHAHAGGSAYADHAAYPPPDGYSHTNSACSDIHGDGDTDPRAYGNSNTHSRAYCYGDADRHAIPVASGNVHLDPQACRTIHGSANARCRAHSDAGTGRSGLAG